jgi:ParB/RepB/Spo0J family partition protein
MARKIPQVARVECSQVKTGRNYRKFSRAQLGDLFYSIKTRGVLQNPILVQGKGQREEKPYELVAGERRFRCCELLRRGFEALIYKDLTEEEFLAIQLAENVKRAINQGELAVSTFDFYKDLIAQKLGLSSLDLRKYSPKTLPEKYRTALPLRDFAVIRGRNESTIRDYFAFATLDKRVQNLVINGKVDYGFAVVLAKLPEQEQLLTALNFKGGISDLKSRIESLRDTGENFVLSSEGLKKKKSSELGSYTSELLRMVGAGVEYFRGSHERFNGQLKRTVSQALDFLYELKDKFEQRAEREGKLGKLRALERGKKAYVEHVIDVHFDLSGKPATDLEGRLMRIDPFLIDRDKEQPRKTFDNEAMRELQKSIEEIGQQQPGMVCPNEEENGKYILIFGERRWRAVKTNNLERVKRGLAPEKYLAKVVSGLTKVERRILQYDEDFHESDKPDERAEAIYRWQEQKSRKGEKLSSSEVISRMGIGRTAVRIALEYAGASRHLKELYQRGLITYNSVAALSNVPADEQKNLGFKVYLMGGNLKAAKRVLELREQDKRNPTLFDTSETGFGYLFMGGLEKYLHLKALARLEKGDIYMPSFANSFFGLVKDLEKLKKYCK